MSSKKFHYLKLNPQTSKQVCNNHKNAFACRTSAEVTVDRTSAEVTVDNSKTLNNVKVNTLSTYPMSSTEKNSLMHSNKTITIKHLSNEILLKSAVQIAGVSSKIAQNTASTNKSYTVFIAMINALLGVNIRYLN